MFNLYLIPAHSCTPKVFLIFYNLLICQSFNSKRISVFPNSKQNRATIGICKRRISLPYALRKSTCCQLAFSAHDLRQGSIHSIFHASSIIKNLLLKIYSQLLSLQKLPIFTFCLLMFVFENL